MLVFGAVQMQNKNINLLPKSLQTLRTSAFSQNVQRITYYFLISACKHICIKVCQQYLFPLIPCTNLLLLYSTLNLCCKYHTAYSVTTGRMIDL